jgi:hypothetical protein
METIIVTRHPALVQVIRERGIAPEGAPVYEHATPDLVRGKRVVGVLPHHLSSLAARVIEVPMALTLEDRQAMQSGDLSLERTREIAGDPIEYSVFRVHDVAPCDLDAAETSKMMAQSFYK